MSLNYEIHDRVLVVKMGNELDHHQAEVLRKEIDQVINLRSIKTLVFDFSQTNFMDSSGIGVIMGRFRLMKEVGGEVKLIHVKDNVQKVLKLSGVYRLVKQYNTLQEAVKI